MQVISRRISVLLMNMSEGSYAFVLTYMLCDTDLIWKGHRKKRWEKWQVNESLASSSMCPSLSTAPYNVVIIVSYIGWPQQKKEKILSCKHCYCIQKLYHKRFLIQPGSKETRKKLFRLNIGDSPNHFLLKGNQVLFPVRWLRLKKISVNFLLFLYTATAV